MLRISLPACLLAFHLLRSVALPEVGDPTIATDHPQYAGEGAFQTVDDCVRFAVHDAGSEQERAIALYMWLLTHQFHLMSPQEWCIPGRVPDTAAPGDYETVVFDANRSRFSYGYGLCGTVHAWNEPYWRALGMTPRRRAFPGHVNSEIFYDGSWHAFDTDMAGLVFRADGVVAGYEDIIANPDLVDSVKPPLPHYPFAWPGDLETMQRGWREVAAGGNWYSMYNSGYEAHPGIVRLRSGETFTRWFDRDHYGGPSRRRFWHHKEGGPFRNWTFVNMGEPVHDGTESNCRGNASYCNGEFVYEPDLASDSYREGTIAESANNRVRAESPRLHCTDGGAASVAFGHFSPYVIAGDPEDDANPMTGPATGGLVVEGTLIGDVSIEVSADEGQTWQAVDEINGDGGGTFQLDLTDVVKGRYGWQIRFGWAGDAGIDELRFTTVTQVAQAIYPRLKPDGTQVTVRTGSRGVVAVLPNFGLQDSETEQFEETTLRDNIVYQGRSQESRRAYQTNDGRPASVVFRVDSPANLVEVRAAVRYQIRVPPLEAFDVRLDVSTDGGGTWREFARADVPSDNEFSSGWLSGAVDVSADSMDRALVRVRLDGGGYRTGLIDAQLYGVYETGNPQELTITYGWREDGRLRDHTESLSAGTGNHSFQIDTGREIVDEFIRLSAP